MDRCPNCGNRLSNIDVLCPKCGAVVEVIQTKSNLPSSPETVKDSDTKEPETVQKKDIPKYFNVYYEDLPAEGSEDSENEAVADEASEESGPSEKAGVNEQANGVRAMIEKSGPEEENGKKGFFNEIVTAKVDDDDNDYSSRYLENLKNINLPEIDDISNFDPEEYMREYKYKKILDNKAKSGDAQAPANKQWLEIEEADYTQPPSPAKAGNDVQNQTDDIPAVGRRYRGAQSDQTEKMRDNRPEVKREISDEEKMQIPANNKKRRMKVASMILFWIVISVAILFSCIFFDNYVKYFGGYNKFIRTITNGQVDLDPGNS